MAWGLNLEEAYPADVLITIIGMAEPTPKTNMVRAPVRAVAMPNSAPNNAAAEARITASNSVISTRHTTPISRPKIIRAIVSLAKSFGYLFFNLAINSKCGEQSQLGSSCLLRARLYRTAPIIIE